jgi:hypothetical protein
MDFFTFSDAPVCAGWASPLRGGDRQRHELWLEGLSPSLAGVSYSTARGWFHLPGFPAFRGVVFWQDFVQWRTSQNGFKNHSLPQRNGDTAAAPLNLPARAAQILLEA